MVKNFPTVERSTKIRFGKNVPDSDVQAENTIVFNASNTLLSTPNSGSIYMAPVKFRDDISNPDIVLMMYNRTTGELSESGESANALVGGQTLQATSDRGNTTSNTLQFTSTDTALTTIGKIGIANSQPGHTLSIGSNVYIDDVGPSNVLVVNGGVSIEGNLAVNGGITTITTENLIIEDAIIEIGKNNTSEDTTLDLGLIMTRPGSNVTVGFKEVENEMVLAYTQSSAYSNTITPIVSEDLDVHVYGGVLTESNVGIKTTSPDAELHVVGNVYVSSNLTVGEDTLHVDVENKSVGIETKNPDANLHVVGNVYVSSNLTVDGDTLHVDVENKSVGIETKNPDANLHVVGNVYVSSNLTVDGDTLHVDVENKSVGIETKNPDANLHVVGNTYISEDLTVATNTLHVESSVERVGIKTKTPDAELHVVGNVYVSEDLTVATNTLHVDVENDSIGVGTVNPGANLHVVGNVYVSSNLTVDGDTLHVDVEADHVGINTKNPNAELHVVGNAYVSSNLTVDGDTLHVDAENDSVGVNTKNPDAELHVVGNAYVSSNLTVDGDTLHVDVEADHVGVNTKNPDAELHVVGNAYVSSNLTVDGDTLHVDAENDSVGINTKNPDAELHVVGNVYVSSNLTVDTDTFHVDAGGKSIGLGTVNPTSNLHVVGNAYVSSNTTTDGTLTLNHPTTAILTDLNSNVEVKLNQLANVVIDTTTLANEDMLVYDGSNWVNQLQNHTFLNAKADETISKGDVVYASGNVGNNTFLIRKAQANSSSTMPALGVAYQDLAENAQGLIVTFGRADGIDTDNFQEGETVYVSNVTAGALSNVKPYAGTDFIQNIGLVVKGHPSTGIVSVTGVGRSNDIPNAPIVADEGDINYVYVNDNNNDLKKILPTNLLTQLQTLEQVSAAGNTTSNIMSFTNSTTSIVTASNAIVGGDISIAGLNVNKLPVVGTGNFLEDSLIGRSNGTIVISSDVEILGNLVVDGNSYIIESNSLVIADRILGIANNNVSHELDIGIVMEHPGKNVALIHHGEAQGDDDPHDHTFTIGYTQNTVTDNHIFDDSNLITVEILGNLITQNNLTVSENMIVSGTSTLSDDFTVGAVSNLFVDVSSSRVGINEGSPTTTLDVNGDVRVQDTTASSSKTTGALIVAGGVGIAGNVHSSNIFAGYDQDLTSYVGRAAVGFAGETNHASFAHIDNNTTVNYAIKQTEGGTTHLNAKAGQHIGLNINNSEKARITGGGDFFVDTDTLYVDAGNDRVGVNKAAPAYALDVVGDINSSAMVKGVTFTGTNLYGTLAGSNTVAASDITASGTVKGATLTGTNVYGTLAGSNTAAVSDLTASAMVKGATITGTNLYGTLAGSNTVAASDITASGTVKGATLTGTNLYGTLAGSNTAAVSDLTASAMVKGATITGTNLYGTLAGSNAAAMTTLSASGVVTLTDTTEATSSTTGALKAAGGVGIAKDVYVGERAYVTGGLITNTGQVTKKTYSQTGTITTGTAPDIGIVFSDHAFSAKITAQLIESDIEISTLDIKVTGGRRGGASTSTLNIAKGPLSIFGDATSNPWSTTVGATTTTVTLTPSTNLDGEGHYNIFVEYVSADTGGSVSTIGGTSTGY